MNGQSERPSLEEIVWNVSSVVKNMSANKLIRKDLLKE